MLKTSDRFVQIAGVVTSKVAELLYAPVTVLNDQGVVITSSEARLTGVHWQQIRNKSNFCNVLRIPLSHDMENGEVLIGEPLSEHNISPQLAQALVKLVVDQVQSRTHPATHLKLKNQFIHDLVHNHIDDESIILNRAKQLGLDLSPPRAVILVNAADYILKDVQTSLNLVTEIERQQQAQMVINSIVNFFHLPDETICADLGQGYICVLKATDTKNLDLWTDGKDIPRRIDTSWANLTALKRAANALRQQLQRDTNASIHIGIGRYHPGSGGIARSYEEAHAALCLGSRLQQQNQVHCLAELGTAAFVGVADETTKIELAKYLLSPLDHEPELLTTIDTFFTENCCASSTSKRLFIHRNTLSYRLDKIASFTGLDPRKFDDAIQIRLSLLLRSLNR